MRFAVLLLLLTIPLKALGEEGVVEATMEEATVAYGSEINVDSRYLWRGLAYGDRPVIQPSVWMSAHDVTLTLWSNADFPAEADRRNYHPNEFDLVVDYTRGLGPIELQPSLSFFFYPNQVDAPATGEFGLKISCPFGPFSLFTSHNFDMIRYGGSYFGDAGLSFEQEIRPDLAVAASVEIGWGSSRFNDAYVGVGKSALNMVGGSLSLTYSPIRAVTICPRIRVSRIVDADLQRESEEPTVVSGWIAMSIRF